MTETAAEPKLSDTMTVIEGFDAMQIFLATVWQRQGRAIADIASILGGARWADGSPVDPAIWQDWLTAVQICKPATRGSMRPLIEPD
ncbi:MAG TPA: hypothetical protein VGJ20_12970 [Xanthobacteraceae bacterium]|jgi:hypothetical protein